MNFQDNKKYIAILLVLAVISFVATHWPSDFMYFISWARRVFRSSATGVESLSSVWEIKGIILRSIYLLMYKISILFTDDLSLLFQSLFKIQTVIFIGLTLSLGAFMLPQKMKIDRVALFLTVALSMFTTHYAVHMEGEFFAVSILFLATCIYLKECILYRIIAGVIIGLLFFIKTPLPIMGGSLFFAALLVKDSKFIEELKSIVPTIVSMVITITIGLFYLYIVSPQEITDLLDARIIQDTIFSKPDKFLIHFFGSFPIGFFRSIWFFPIFGISLMLLARNYRFLNTKQLLSIVGIFAFPSIYVIVSNCFYVYHYFLFAYPSIIIAGGFIELKNIPNKRYVIISLFFAILFFVVFYKISYYIPSSNILWAIIAFVSICMWIFNQSRYIEYIYFTLLFFVILTNDFCFSPATLKSNKEYKEYLSDTKILGTSIGGYLGNPNDSVLFLDCAVSSFYIQNNSHSRYFYPQIVQRTDEENSINVHSDVFKKAQKEILDYKGQYIVLNNWFFTYDHPAIRSFLDMNYEVIESVDFISYWWDLFEESDFNHTEMQILRRKE